MHYNPAVPQPFLLLIAVNFAETGYLGCKWSLWPVPDFLSVQRIKAKFYLTLYDSTNYMKLFRTVSITPQPCHGHFCCWFFCCWLLVIWPKLDVWAENRAYGLCQLGWRYNGAKLSFSWTYMIVSMIWNTSEMSPSHLSRATVIFVADGCQFVPSWIFGLKNGAYGLCRLGWQYNG